MPWTSLTDLDDEWLSTREQRLAHSDEGYFLTLRKDLGPEICRRLKLGDSNYTIAHALNVTENTVRYHLKRMRAAA